MPTLRKFIDKCNIDAETRYDEPMSRHTTFRIGGPADVFTSPRSPESFSRLLHEARSEGIPLAVVGGGANVLVADAGVRGIVASTNRLGTMTVMPGGILYAGAGLPVVDLVREAQGRGLAGVEFAAGLPGSIGGAVYMNARCYDREFADIIERVDFILADPGAGYQMKPGSTIVDHAAWAYKRTPFMPGGRLAGAVITGAGLRLEPGDPVAISTRIAQFEADRAAKGHFDYPSAGSMFRNDRVHGRPAGRILDELGFRGRRIGDAMVNPKHANIFVNAGAASADDMMDLIEMARTAARAAFGFELVPEVVFLGEFQSQA
jgi:UDP-N-acetylmuramate dehydrogenase